MPYVKYLQGNLYVAPAGVDNTALNNMNLWGLVTFPVFVFETQADQTTFHTALRQFNNTNDYAGFKALFETTFNISYDSLQYPVFFAYANGADHLATMPIYPASSRTSYSVNPIIQNYALTDRYDVSKNPTYLRAFIASDTYYIALLFDSITNGMAIQLEGLNTSYTLDGNIFYNATIGQSPAIINNYESSSTSDITQTRIRFGINTLCVENGLITRVGRTTARMSTPTSNINVENAGYTTDANAIAVWNSFAEYTPAPTGEDPYAPGGTSAPSQATGDFDLSSDAVDFPALPTLTAVSTGLVSIYTPDLQQINSLASYLWNADVTTVEWWKKLVANPLDLVLGLSIVPVAVPTAGANSVKVGFIDTGVTMNRASTQFVEVPCGSINITEFYGGALDYLPYRKTSIYLPFIGTRTLSTDDIMGKTVEVKYHVDLLSGALTALVKCGDAVLYQYSGACAVSLPLTGETFTNMITSTIQLAASGGMGAIALGGGAAGGAVAGAAVAGAAISGGASLANSVISSKPTIERAGGVSGAAGQLGIMTPYLIGEIPRQSVPENYNTFVGYPSNIKSTLGDLTGFTSVESIHLQNIPATAAEYAEIEQLLKEGVIL